MIEHASIYEQFPKRDMNPTYQEVFTRASCYVLDAIYEQLALCAST